MSVKRNQKYILKTGIALSCFFFLKAFGCAVGVVINPADVSIYNRMSVPPIDMVQGNPVTTTPLQVVVEGYDVYYYGVVNVDPSVGEIGVSVNGSPPDLFNVSCNEDYELVAQSMCVQDPNNPSSWESCEFSGVEPLSGSPDYSAVEFYFQNTTHHAMIAYIPKSARLSLGSSGYDVLPPNATAETDSTLELGVSVNPISGANMIAEINGARFYVSDTADQTTFDTEIGLTLPSQASSSTGSSYNAGNAMGLVQIQGGSYPVNGGTCDLNSVNDMISCFSPPQNYVWEVAPANIVGPCGAAGGVGAFCWGDDGSGSAGFNFNLQDPFGRIVGS